MSQWSNNSEIKIFREYLQIPTAHPDIDYAPCIEFLKKQAADLELPVSIVYPADPKKPVLILTWEGTNPYLPTIHLNSHMDVVPACEKDWTYPPFSAHMDENGRIYSRGAQDMKCVAMQYLAAIRAMKLNGIRLLRTVHVIFVPDEEIGGETGMKAFIQTDSFKSLNIGFVLDEGYASENDKFFVFYGERTSWRPRIACKGTAGHGSLLLENTAAEKLQYIINKFMDFRRKELKRLTESKHLTIGDVTSINLTLINGGILDNVIPSDITAVFDVRIALDVDHLEFEETLRSWCKEAGENVTLDFIHKLSRVEPTKVNETNPFWMAFKMFFETEMNESIKPMVCPARGDTCYVREAGIPALGFSPMKNTECLMHDHNEYLDADVYLEGINIYKSLIQRLANVP